MEFKAKLRKIGNSQGVYIPKNVITSYKIGDVITLNVITSDDNVITKQTPTTVVQTQVNSPQAVKNWHNNKFDNKGKFKTFFK